MSTGVICSLVSCYKKSKSPENKVVKVALDTDLLSIELYSFQSLGESVVMRGLYDQAFFIESGKLKSKFFKSFKVKEKEIYFSSEDEFNIFKENFGFLQNSVLWKDFANKFEIKNTSLVYKPEGGFHYSLYELSQILKLSGEKFGAYKVSEHQKGNFIKLTPNPQWYRKKRYPQRDIVFTRYSTSKNAYLAVIGKTAHIFFPRAVSKSEYLKFRENLKTMWSKNFVERITLYAKKGVPKDPLLKLYCSEKKSLLKILDPRWFEKNGGCKRKLKPFKIDRSYAVILTNESLYPLVDTLAQSFKKSYGYELKYKYVTGQNLTQILKKGDFDFYFTLDHAPLTLIHTYESLHSKGKYNTFNLASESLDTLLEKSLEVKSFAEFFNLQAKINTEYNKVSPEVFTLEANAIKYISDPDFKIGELEKIF